MYKTLFTIAALAAFAQAQNNACDRACLEGFVNQYLAALEVRDPSKLPLAKNAKYTENGVQLKLGDGMWGPVVKMTDYKLYFADPKVGQVGFYGSLEEHGHPAILGLRLKIEDRKISEIEAIVLRSTGRGVFSDVKALKVDPIMTKPLAPSEKRSRDELITASDAYFEGMEKGNRQDHSVRPGLQAHRERGGDRERSRQCQADQPDTLRRAVRHGLHQGHHQSAGAPLPGGR